MKKHIRTFILVAAPMVGCLCVSCSTQQASTFSILKQSNAVNVSVSSTRGKAFTFEGESTAEPGKKYRCRFISTMYEIETGIELPIHAQLKPTDLEVMCNGENIISKCSLVDNTLTIPGELITEHNITINILGAQIADWITWDDIRDISAKDEGSSKDIMTNYFQVGDYKAVYKDAKLFGHARIIDFYHDKYLKNISGIQYIKTASSSWEIYDKPICTNKFGYYMGLIAQDPNGYFTHPWGGKDTQLRSACNSFRFDGFPEKKAYITSSGSYTTEDYFFVATYKELTGEAFTAKRHKEANAEEEDKDQLYAYYDVNRYICSKDGKQRRIKPIGGGAGGKYHTRTVFTREDWFPESARYDGSVCFRASTGEVVYGGLCLSDSDDGTCLDTPYPAYGIFIV